MISKIFLEKSDDFVNSTEWENVHDYEKLLVLKNFYYELFVFDLLVKSIFDWENYFKKFDCFSIEGQMIFIFKVNLNIPGFLSTQGKIKKKKND